MALFKILKGNSSRIDMSVTPFHDGYAYFTPDDGGFYIDSEDSGIQKRHRINKSVAISATLLSTNWNAGEQTLQIEGVTENSNGMIGLSQTISAEEMESAKNAELYVCDQGNGTVTIAAFGETPTKNIPVVIILLV